jgi:hypothetical protein
LPVRKPTKLIPCGRLKFNSSIIIFLINFFFLCSSSYLEIY